jgi:hypothetical protein
VSRAAGLVTNCHGKQVTKNTFFGEFAPRAMEIVDSRVIVRIIPAQHLADKERVRFALPFSMKDAKESNG